MKSKFEGIGCGGTLLIVVGIIALAIAIFCAEGWVVMKLWNWLAVGLFSLPEVSFKMALGIMVLLNLITGGFKVSCGSSK
jgi:hypothetical protein